MDIYEKINSGCYKVSWEYPGVPTDPFKFKRVGEMSDAELADAPRLRKEYEDAKKAYLAERGRWYDEQRALEEQFYRDLAADYGMDADDAFVKALYGVAWQNGHSGGFSDVVSQFTDLVPLWELYEKK